MGLWRVAAAAVLVVALGWASAAPTVRASAPTFAIPCAPAVLTAHLRNVHDVADYGCEGSWAFLWADVGPGSIDVGVTEVEHYEGATLGWRVVARLAVCRPGVLPAVVYERGCFSN
ncbi:MAG: hypothetical protein ACP5PB_04310 [Acidimicrobiales bacterium]